MKTCSNLRSTAVLYDRTDHSSLRAQTRRERLWAWLSLFTLVICWDASLRLEQRVSPPRPRLEHASSQSGMGAVERATG